MGSAFMLGTWHILLHLIIEYIDKQQGPQSRGPAKSRLPRQTPASEDEDRPLPPPQVRDPRAIDSRFGKTPSTSRVGWPRRKRALAWLERPQCMN